MSRRSVYMITNTVLEANVTGKPVRADRFRQYTIAIHPNNLSGRVYIEGSLAPQPVESDWFAVSLNGTTPYIQFPQAPYNPTGRTGDTGAVGYTIIGNFIWLRVRLDRSYLLISLPFADQDQIALFGNLDRVLLNN